jgi:hypothetical protein
MSCRNPWFYGVVLIACSCAAADTEAPVVASARSAISVDNDLSYNRLALNRLALNRLALNRLALNRLSDNRLALNSLDGLERTEEGRDLLHYAAQCALRQGDILIAEHAGQVYEFPGLLGLAPEWEHGPLSESKQRLISACLISHVNAYGESVVISLRSAGALDADADERTRYAVYEGSFFGQVFDGEAVKAYACQGSAPDIARVHADDRLKRVCADPSTDCEIVSVGRCRDVCETPADKQGWNDCWADGRRYAETMSVFLRADDPDGQNRSCFGHRNCHLRPAPGTAAILDCGESSRCQTGCSREGVCTLDSAESRTFHAVVSGNALSEMACLDTADCSLHCQDGARCEVDCVGAQSCAAHCQRGARCDINCRNAADCASVRCAPGAQCALHCAGAERCGFSMCTGALVHCPGDVIVCDRACP